VIEEFSGGEGAVKRNLLFSFAVTAVLQLGPVAVCRRILSVL
jgi:hypothetical protein